MLGYDDALQLLYRYGGDAPWIRHCVAVSRVAAGVAEIMHSRSGIDSRLLTVGALLHDIGRYRTHDPVLHGVEGYRLLSSLGHDREAFICASHVLCGMPAEEAVVYGLPARDFLPVTLEERLIPVIDSVVELDRPTTLEERSFSIRKRYQHNPVFLQRFGKAADAARSFLQLLERDFGISLEKIAVEVLENEQTPGVE